MSHFRHRMLTTIGVTALLMTSASFVTAEASTSKAKLKASVTASATESTTFSTLRSPSGHSVLDWRNPSQTFQFDVPSMNWTSALKITLSADPVGNVSSRAPLYVQFNNGDPIKVNTRGRGFDAPITLDPAKVRAKNNVIRVFYGAPSNAECLLPQHGAWTLNLEKSKLSVRSNPKSRQLHLGDLKSLLSNPLTAPKSVGLVSYGSQSAAIDSFLAQGMGLRLPHEPKFTTLANRSDIDIIAGKRNQISRYVNDKNMLQNKGPLLALDKGRPARIIITGDTDAEVLSVAQAFAQYHLPRSRRAATSPGEFKMQSAFAQDNITVTHRTKLSELGDTAFEQNWNPRDQVLKFDVEDPIASSGEVLLRVAAPKEITQTDSRLSLELNGYSIGQTQLDKKRKTVSFNIPHGLLVGQDNVLSLKPSLDSKAISQSLSGCAAQNYATHSVYFSKASKLILTQNGETPLNDLSRLSANGAPFSDANGRDTLIVLPKGKSDYHAALSVMAKLAETNSEGWSEAHYVRGTNSLSTHAEDKNVLFIIPSQTLPREVVEKAPKSLRAALRGQPFKGDNLLAVEIERYASGSSEQSYQAAARKVASRNYIKRGGVAALYRSPYQNDKMAAIITNSSKLSFSQSVRSLTQDEHWNALEGSVARWNKNTVLMAELSSPLMGFERSKQNNSVPQFADAIQGIGLPDLSAVSFKMAEFKPSIDWDGLKEKTVFWNRSNEEAPTVQMAEIPQVAPMPPKLAVAKTPSTPIRNYSQTSSRDTGGNYIKVSDFSKEASKKGKSFLDSVLPETTLEKAGQALTASPSQRQRILRDMSGESKKSYSIKKPDMAKFERQTQEFFKAASYKMDAMKTSVRNLRIDQKIEGLQKQLRPISNSWRTKLNNITIPGASAARWSVRQISAAGLLLMLIFGIVIFFLGFSNASSRTGDHH